MKKPNPKLIDRDNPEWTEDTFARARPAKEVFPDLVEYSARDNADSTARRRHLAKVPMSLRIDRDVLAFYKGAGRGWQDRMNEALRRAAKLCTAYPEAAQGTMSAKNLFIESRRTTSSCSII